MSEMLGNQFFLSRKYSEACTELKFECEKNPYNFTALKKLVICYLQTDQLDAAFNSFLKLLEHDVSIITNTDLVRDDCPCPELIANLSSDMSFGGGEEDEVKLGILWLYCDVQESFKHFTKISKENRFYDRSQIAIKYINSYLNHTA